MGQRKHSPLSHVSPGFYAKHPNPYIKLFADLPKSPNVISPPKTGIWPEYQAEMTAAFEQVALGKKTAKEALDYVQNRVEMINDDYQSQLKARREAGK